MYVGKKGKNQWLIERNEREEKFQILQFQTNLPKEYANHTCESFKSMT